VILSHVFTGVSQNNSLRDSSQRLYDFKADAMQFILVLNLVLLDGTVACFACFC
jgi:hypothetical protein